MDNNLSYPTDAMDLTANNVQQEISNALPTHHQIIHSITTLDGLFPGNVETTFVSHIKSWAQNVEATYDSLNKLANNLSQGSQNMAETDHTIGQGLTPQ